MSKQQPGSHSKQDLHCKCPKAKSDIEQNDRYCAKSNQTLNLSKNDSRNKHGMVKSSHLVSRLRTNSLYIKHDSILNM